MNNRNIKLNRKNQGGFSLVELGFVAILIAIGIIAVVSKFGGSKADTDAKAEADVFMDVYTKTLDTKSAGSYGTSGQDLLPLLIAKRAIPSSYTTTGNTVANRYLGQFTVASAGQTALLTTNNIPKEACIEVGRRSSNGGVGSMKINGSAVTLSGLSDSTIAAACNQDGNANSVAVGTPN